MGTYDSTVGAHETFVSPPDRHCGRCQRAFPADPKLFFQTDWALCPECKEILLPH